MRDIEIVREAIELFAVNYFDTIEMAGSIQFEEKEMINYFSFDLREKTWDGNLNKLHQELVKYLQEWAKKNTFNFDDYVSISRITIEYLLPEKEGANQNQSKHVKLFYLPSYYFQGGSSRKNKSYPAFVLVILNAWYNIILRNTVIVGVPTILLTVLALCKIKTDELFVERLTKSYDYINIASGIIASFVLGYLVNKVIVIRQDKLKYTKSIKLLSNKLTYFRNICFNLSRDHILWGEDNPAQKSFAYANSIKNDITYEEYHYPNYDDDVLYAKFKSFYKEDVSHSVVSLILQLHMMADDSFLHSGLTYTKFAPNHIYSSQEMERFNIFCESNLIWYCCTETLVFPDTFRDSHYAKEVLEDVKRIYPKKQVDRLTKKLLEETSLDFQYKFIPRLFSLTKVVEAKLPLVFRYFMITFSLLFMFGLIVPAFVFAFFERPYALLSVFVVVGIMSHILLCLNPILNTENTLDRDNDYL